MSWQDIAQLNGIESPVNGSWEQAICESLGILEPINGSWIQALAQYGPFQQPLENTASVTDITYGEIYQIRGVDVVDVQLTINFGIPFIQENVYNSLTYIISDPGVIHLFLENGNGGNPFYTMGFVSNDYVITEPQMTVVGESYDVVITMFTVNQDLSTRPKASLPIIHSFTSTPPTP